MQGALGFAVAAAFVISGCGSSKPAASNPCGEGKPLACEQQEEREAQTEPEGGPNISVQAQKRLSEGKTPTVEGEDSGERFKRAEEEVRAGRP
jgi:hypothetical protein